MNNYLVWHNEEHQSWTYCGMFWVLKTTSDTFQLYRDNRESFVLALVGTFPDRETARIMAQMITMAEKIPSVCFLWLKGGFENKELK